MDTRPEKKMKGASASGLKRDHPAHKRSAWFNGPPKRKSTLLSLSLKGGTE